MGFDKSYSRQRLRADFTLAHYAYQTYKYLDFNGITGRVAWDWPIGDRWNGTLSSSFVATSAASIAASSALSPKISVLGFAEWRKRELGGESGAFDSVLRNPSYTHYYTLTGTRR